MRRRSELAQAAIQILPIAEQYIEGFYHCLDEVARERAYLAFVQAPPLASVREFVRANLAGNVPQFVAVHGDRVVGWCDISPERHEGFGHSGRLGMGVLKEYRSRGIGTRLIAAAMDAARERGLERIELEVFASNRPAIGLYEKMGFVVEGIKRKARKLDGTYQDIVCMARLF